MSGPHALLIAAICFAVIWLLFFWGKEDMDIDTATPHIPINLQAPQAEYPAAQRTFHQRNQACLSGDFEKCRADRKSYVAEFGLTCRDWIGEIVYKSVSMDTILICSGADGIILAFVCFTELNPDTNDRGGNNYGFLTAANIDAWKAGDAVTYSGEFVPNEISGIYENNVIGFDTLRCPAFYLMLQGIKSYPLNTGGI